MEPFDGLLREALILCALLSFPILCAATLVGTIVAIVQAATQVQEQTLTLLPKLTIVALALVLFGHAGFAMCAQLIDDAVLRFPDLVRAGP